MQSKSKSPQQQELIRSFCDRSPIFFPSVMSEFDFDKWFTELNISPPHEKFLARTWLEKEAICTINALRGIQFLEPEDFQRSKLSERTQNCIRDGAFRGDNILDKVNRIILTSF